MAECKVEIWTLKELSDALSSGIKDKKKIVVPMFQRGKRWDNNADKEQKFLDSLQKNYPVGTLLFYQTEENGVKQYTLIDGLQRSTTIHKLLTKPTKFFDIKRINQEVLDALYNELNVSKEKQKEIVEIIVSYIRQLDDFDAFNMIKLINIFNQRFNCIDNSSFMKIDEILSEPINDLKKEFKKLCNIQIPALIYTGPEETLAEIFDRVNSQGVPLSDYEIFVASWPKEKFYVSNVDIIEKNVEKYNFLSNDIYELKDYKEETFKNEKMLNSFEYVFGLSKYLCEKYDCLKFNMNVGADIANPVGFELINAIFNNSHKKLKDVYQNILKFKDKIEVLESNIESCVKFVSDCINPITRFKSNTHGESGKVFHSQLQILSMIAYTFRKKYNLEELSENSTWNETKRKLESNFIKYYVLDIITKYWHEGGGKIYAAISDDRYLKGLSAKVFSNALDTYSDNSMLRKEKTQVKGVSEIDYVIMNAIYLNSFTAHDQLSSQKYDVEHIAPKEQMKKLIKKTDSEGLPISHIANLCYLPEEANRSKQEKNFYQDNHYLTTAGITLSEIENKYSFTTRDDLLWMDRQYFDGDNELLQNYYLNYLQNRYKTLKSKFLFSMGYSSVEEYKAKPKIYYGGYTNDYFVSTKIGKVMQECFGTLSENVLLSEDVVLSLQNKEYSKETLDCNYPVLVDSLSKTYITGKTRYYTGNTFSFYGKVYYLSNEWYADSREIIVSWLKQKLEIEENDI